MNISFIYPCDAFSPKKIDEDFESEANLIKESGFSIHLINTEDINSSKSLPESMSQDSLIYRGWMLGEESYKLLFNKLNKQLITSPEQYLYAHHLPNWYNDLKEFTMPSVYSVGEDTKALYEKWGDKPAFVKDYVKSLKTSRSPIVDSFEDLLCLVADMKKFRGHIEGGIVLRDPKDLINSSETRFFVINGSVFSKDDSVQLEMSDFAKKVAISVTNSSFFSIDLVKDQSGKIWLIEIGDGQVSDSVGWSQESFINIFQLLKLQKKIKP